MCAISLGYLRCSAVYFTTSLKQNLDRARFFMAERLPIVTLKLAFPSGTTAEEQENMTQLLRQELLETNVISAETIADRHLPAGSKGISSELSSLLVTLAGSGSILGTLISTIGNWLGGHKKCNVTVKMNGDEITLIDASEENERALVKAWIARHSAGK
jgi:hypothetical protein